MKESSIWCSNEYDDVLEDNESLEEEDPTCPTILLTAQEKRMLQEPWKDALIVKLFDKGVAYMQLKKEAEDQMGTQRLTYREDYEHVLMDDPWMIGDSYLVIRERVPNFTPEEDKIMKLTTWVRIPKLGVEYFNKHILLNKIDSIIGTVLKLANTTANVEQGPILVVSKQKGYVSEVGMITGIVAKPKDSKRRRFNRIEVLQHEEGEWITKPDRVRDMDEPATCKKRVGVGSRKLKPLKEFDSSHGQCSMTKY
ncbi:hypothetical protein Cgig2_016378 [Carnegiea gigantea]|uniref:DUF4283 domain-containing protein n=1 Tax=Carnegiea gigantea TaxID=171969 RepID=A0A9Q1GLE8_9CARY|nr:hypothetical protein Cgig2_016378 [Carnegiea gigantea]